MSDQKIRLGGLWRQKSKTVANSPDINMYLAPDDWEQEAIRQYTPGGAAF